MIKILFQDENLLVIEKPPGLTVTATETQSEDTLEDILKRDFKILALRSGIVHRLDKDTSGLMVIAKNNAALGSLQSQFKSRTTKKEYLALVHGHLRQPGKVTGAILRNPGNREKFTVVKGLEEGKEAGTLYQPEQLLIMSQQKIAEIFVSFNKIQLKKLDRLNYQQFTLVRCFPLTGRTHQIRVHLKYINFPIIGDDKYGGRKVVRLDHRWCSRQFLHAVSLEFDHPITGSRLSFESKLPEDLEKALGNLDRV